MARKNHRNLRFREAWLLEAVEELRILFKQHDVVVPKKIRVSVGFPYMSRTATGECWEPKASADGTQEIFVSPTLAKAEDVLSTLSHELVHTIAAGHKKDFVNCAKKVGLTEGPPKNAGAGPELRQELHRIAVKLHAFPHAPLTPATPTKQTTRLVKTECPDCGYIARVTHVHLDEKGPPICPECRIPFIEEIKE